MVPGPECAFVLGVLAVILDAGVLLAFCARGGDVGAHDGREMICCPMDCVTRIGHEFMDPIDSESLKQLDG